MKYDFELDLSADNNLAVLLNRVKPHSVILEFGCANGRITKYLQEQLHCEVYAVELDEKAAVDARRYAKKVVVENCENYGWKEEFSTLVFDHIIFADVLEHLYDPKQVLLESKSFLKEDGTILVSLPNIAHNAIIIDLMKNEFNYDEVGLLDETHIRFFTKKTFDRLVLECGYSIGYESAIFVHPSNTTFDADYDQLPQCVGDFLAQRQYGELYHLIYELKKHSVEKIDEMDRYQNSAKNFIQLYVDTTNGFNEQESIKQIFENQEKVVFDLSGFENIQSVRLDPLNTAVAIQLDNITINGETAVSLSSSNVYYSNGNSFYFLSDDPQIYISFENQTDIKNITFEVKYLHTDKKVSKQLLEKLKNDLDQLRLNSKKIRDENSIHQTIQKELTDQSVKLTQQLDTKKVENKNFQEELEQIYSSKLWKILTTIRKVLHSVKIRKKEKQ